eukprot:s1856_g15.t1
MSVAGLRYCPSSPSGLQETKSGAYVYSGDPSHFHEWQFRTLLRVELCKKRMEQKAKEKAKEASRSPTASPASSGQGRDRPTEAAGSGQPGARPAEMSPQATSSGAELGGFASPRERADEDDNLDVSPYVELVTKIMEGLRGDAFLLAKDMGLSALMDVGPPTGLELRVERIKELVFPLRSHEARELFRIGQLANGPLSRQSSETILSFIGRRKRWWIQLKELDPEMTISTQMRAELLLETSGLSRQEQLMVKTACPKPSFEGYCEVLLEHHGKIHLRDSRNLAPPSKPFQQKGAGKGKGKGWYRSGYYVGDYGDYENYEGDETAGNEEHQEWNADYGDGAYVGYEQEPSTVSDEEVGMALMAMAELTDEATAEASEELGEACQHQLQAYAAMGRVKGKGPFKGAGKGKDKDKGKGKGKRIVKTQLSIQDRKAKLASLKKNSRCLRCGGYGHWAGDPECKMPNKKPGATSSGQSSGQPNGKVGYFALSDPSEDDNPLPCMVIGAGKKKNSFGYMGYRIPQRSPAAKANARSPPRASPATSDGSFTQVSMSSPNRVPRMPAFRARREDPMSDAALPPGSDHIFTFGQHRGYTYHEVLMQYPGYYLWGCNEPGASRILVEFLDWVDMHYDVDHGTQEVTPKPVPEDVPARPAPVPGSRSRHKTVKKRPPNPPIEIPGHVCKDFAGEGTNAYVLRKTCRECGKITQTPKNPTFSQDLATCNHAITDKRGSTKTTSRTFCLLCGTHVDEMPRDEGKRREALGKAVSQGAAPMVDLAEDLLKYERLELLLSTEDSVAVMTQFQQDCEVELEHDPHMRASVMVDILRNAIEAVIEARDHAAHAGHAAPSHAAYVTLSPLEDELECDALRVVDILNDDHVWGVLDEGCNSTVCGHEWMETCKAKLKILGFDVPMQSDVQKAFKGLAGDVRTKGRFRIPFVLEPEGGRKLPGVLETYVVGEPGDPTPLLLSQHAQAALGLVKDMATSTCTLGKDGPTLKLHRTKDSGLLCICLSKGLANLKFRETPTQSKELQLPDSMAYVGTVPRTMAPAGQSVLIYTAGMDFCPLLVSYHNDPTPRNLERLCGMFSDLAGREVFVVNTLALGDPHHNKELRSHIGTHPDILAGLVRSDWTMQVMHALIRRIKQSVDDGKSVGVIAYCHRSVALGWLVANALEFLEIDSSLKHANATSSGFSTSTSSTSSEDQTTPARATSSTRRPSHPAAPPAPPVPPAPPAPRTPPGGPPRRSRSPARPARDDQTEALMARVSELPTLVTQLVAERDEEKQQTSSSRRRARSDSRNSRRRGRSRSPRSRRGYRYEPRYEPSRYESRYTTSRYEPRYTEHEEDYSRRASSARPPRSPSPLPRRRPQQRPMSVESVLAGWPSHLNLPAKEDDGATSWNQRVEAHQLSVELLDAMWYAAAVDNPMAYKQKCLRWIGPYFPGSNAQERKVQVVEENNMAANVKVVVLGADYIGICLREPHDGKEIEYNSDATGRIFVYHPTREGSTPEENAPEENGPGDDGGDGPGDDIPGDDHVPEEHQETEAMDEAEEVEDSTSTPLAFEAEMTGTTEPADMPEIPAAHAAITSLKEDVDNDKTPEQRTPELKVAKVEDDESPEKVSKPKMFTEAMRPMDPGKFIDLGSDEDDPMPSGLPASSSGASEESLSRLAKDWSTGQVSMTPRTFQDACGMEFHEMLKGQSETLYLDRYARTCFVGELVDEMSGSDDQMLEDDKPLTPAEHEQLMLDQLAIPGAPLDEAQRRAKWRALPTRTRIAIRRTGKLDIRHRQH